MNKVIEIGRLTRDPEVARRQKADGTELVVATYSMAVDRRTQKDGQDSADFIPCKCFDKRAEFAEKYLKKGSKIAICGHLQSGSYTNKDGVKVYTLDVIVEEHDFCESKGSGAATPATPAAGNEDFMNIPDDIDEELPFN